MFDFLIFTAMFILIIVFIWDHTKVPKKISKDLDLMRKDFIECIIKADEYLGKLKNGRYINTVAVIKLLCATQLRNEEQQYTSLQYIKPVLMKKRDISKYMGILLRIFMAGNIRLITSVNMDFKNNKLSAEDKNTLALLNAISNFYLKGIVEFERLRDCKFVKYSDYAALYYFLAMNEENEETMNIYLGQAKQYSVGIFMEPYVAALTEGKKYEFLPLCAIVKADI